MGSVNAVCAALLSQKLQQKFSRDSAAIVAGALCFLPAVRCCMDSWERSLCFCSADEHLPWKTVTAVIHKRADYRNES